MNQARTRGSVRMLASVRTSGEALRAAHWGADIIDVKEPAHGALGALPLEAVREIVRTLRAAQIALPVSATVGDLPMQPDILLPAVDTMQRTGIDIVKFGMFPGRHAVDCLAALADLPQQASRVAVFFADHGLDRALCRQAARSALRGLMLDTQNKDGRSLLDCISLPQLRHFIALTREQALWVGLAGSLRVQHVAMLLALEPDYLGFRGALCARGERSETLQRQAFVQVRKAITRERPATCMQAHGISALGQDEASSQRSSMAASLLCARAKDSLESPT